MGYYFSGCGNPSLFYPYSTPIQPLSMPHLSLIGGVFPIRVFKEIAMHKRKTRLTTALTSGKKRTHGGYTYFTTGRLPEHRKYIEQYLTAARLNLIQDLGPTEEHLTAAQIIIIDRVVSKLGVIRCIEEHIRENSVMIGDTLAPSLKESYLAYNNSIRLDLQALGINSKKAEGIMDLGKYVEEKYGKRKEEE